MKTDLVRVLTRDEITQCIRALEAKRSTNGRINAMLFRLSCCVGLRRKEIVGLSIRDVLTGGSRPVVNVPAAITKAEKNGKRHKRSVPLWWDEGTRLALEHWKQEREAAGAKQNDPFVCIQRLGHEGNRFTRQGIAKRWKTALKALPADRIRQLSIHTGRRSYVSHCLAIGHSVAEVAAACGHSNIGTTNQYTHLIEVDGVADVFQFVSAIEEE